MAFKHEDVIIYQGQQIEAEQAQAFAQLEAARHAEDAHAVTLAADRILELDLKRNALNVRANSYVAAQQAQSQGNKYGLNQDELEIARGSFGDTMTRDEKERLYAQNKERLRVMRATGQYRDDQGTVSR